MVKIRVDSEQHRKWLRRGMLSYLKSNFSSLSSALKESIVAKSFDFFASSSSYPLIRAGPSLALKNSFSLPSLYSKPYKEVVFNLASSAFAMKFVSPESSSEEIKFLSMSTKPVYVEALFSKRPSLRFDFSSITQPVGPRAPLKKLVEQENPKIPKKVYSLYDEKLKARVALEELYSFGYNYYYLARIMSSGVLGQNKKFVPTRWAITATDSSLADFNVSLIKDFKHVEGIELYYEEHFFNKFIVVLLPGNYEFENFEAWAPKTTWASSSGYYVSEEYENLKGRKSYPYSQAGAYYAVKFAVSEFLRKRRRQARIIVFREVSEGYQIPLGVWHVRETVNSALSKKPLRFNSKNELYTKLQKLLTLPFPIYFKKSKIMGQKRITDY